MPKAFPREFREDVVAIARRREVSFAQIAKDFGISKSALSTWLQKAELQDRGFVSASPEGKEGDAAALREALKRIRLLEQEAEVMRRAVAYLSQAQLPK